MYRYILLYNPYSMSGASLLRREMKALHSRCMATRARLECITINDLESVRDAPGRMIVLGGDGTINAAVTWLLRQEYRCPLGIVPAGTGNNLARSLGIPRQPEAAWEMALEGYRTRAIDASTYKSLPDDHSRVMIQNSALGYPAEMAIRYDTLRRHRILRILFRRAGNRAYWILGLTGLLAQKRRERRGENVLHLRCRLPGEEIEEEVLAVFVGNAPSIGGNFIPCPRAELDDGALDICMVRAGTGVRYLKLFREIIRGQHLALESAVAYRQSCGPVELLLSRPGPLLADGDIWVQGDHFRFEVLPGHVEVICG